MSESASVSRAVLAVDFGALTNASHWRIVNDGVMGGVSTSSLHLTNALAVFAGEVSLENNGGFASVRSDPAAYGLAGVDALIVRVRGDGHRYKLTIRTDDRFDGVNYQATFATARGAWEEHVLPVSTFVPSWRGRVLKDEPPLDPAKVASLGFMISDKQEGPFRLEIAWIKGRRAGT